MSQVKLARADKRLYTIKQMNYHV